MCAQNRLYKILKVKPMILTKLLSLFFSHPTPRVNVEEEGGENAGSYSLFFFFFGLHEVYSQTMSSTDLFIYLFIRVCMALSTRVECLSRGYTDSPGDEVDDSVSAIFCVGLDSLMQLLKFSLWEFVISLLSPRF